MPEMLDRPHSALAMSTHGTRPRRSASMSEANVEEPHHAHMQQPYMRPSNVRGARRVTLEEKLRQEQEMAYRGTPTVLRSIYHYSRTQLPKDTRESSEDSDEIERKCASSSVMADSHLCLQAAPWNS